MSTNDNDFAALGIAPELAACLSELGYEAPTPIQQQAIPAMIAGYDLLCQAATGTGKTAAFALPILNRRAGADNAAKGVWRPTDRPPSLGTQARSGCGGCHPWTRDGSDRAPLPQAQ